jgi:maleate isomerase
VITVGVLTPHAAAGADVEFAEMAPTQVRTAISRVRPLTIGSEVGDPPSSVDGLRALATPAALDTAVSALSAPVSVLAYASTSSGYAIGYDAEAALVERLRRRWRVPVCSTSMSGVTALQSSRIERISLVHPPWFGQPQNELGIEYFASQGFEVVEARLADLPDDSDRIEPGMVAEWVAGHVSPHAEAVVIGGNGFRAARAVQDLEDRLGRLVLESNQVLLWAVLEAVGVPIAIRGFGRLFDRSGR